MKSVKVAITGVCGLQRYALEQLLLQTEMKVNPVTVGEESMRSADFHICSASEFVRHLDFYMPHKDRVLVLTAADSRHGDTMPQGISTICISDRIEHIESRLARCLNALCGHDAPAGGDLTQREKQVLRHIASGKTIKEIACELDISVNTALTHRKNISAKLGIRSVSGLSLYAMINGIL